MTQRRTVLALALGISAGVAAASRTSRARADAGSDAAGEFYVTTMVELDSALAAAQAGDSIILKDGIWSNTHIVIAGAGGSWPVANHGAPGAPITLRAETRGGVVFTGQSWINLARDHWVLDGFQFRDGHLFNGDYGVIHLGLPMAAFPDRSEAEANFCEITHCTIKDYNPALAGSQYNWVRLMGTNNTVSWSHFSGKNNKLDMVSAHWRKSFPGTPTRHWFHHNYFGDIAPTSENGFGALTPVMGRPGGVTDEQWPDIDEGILIEDNLFHACNGESEIISIKTSANIVRRNTFIECLGYLNLRMGNRSEVSSNYFFGGDRVSEDAYFPGGVPVGESGGIRVSGGQHRVFNNYIDNVHGSGIWIQNGSSENAWYGYLPVKDLTVLNNTIVNPGRAAFTIGAGISRATSAPSVPGGGVNVPPENLTFANNLVLGRSDEDLIQYGRWPWSLDDVEPTQPTEPVNPVWIDNVLYGSPIGEPEVVGEIEAVDPELQLHDRNGTDVLAPGATSPVSRWGCPYAMVREDIEGHPRPRGRWVAAGAHEHVWRPAVPYPPLTAAEVGPSYVID